jgi:hypothetical protein
VAVSITMHDIQAHLIKVSTVKSSLRSFWKQTANEAY